MKIVREKEEKNYILKMVFMGACLVLVVVLSFFWGRYDIAPGELLGVVVSQFVEIEPFWPANAENLIFHVRLPRILMAPLVGGCLAVAGVSYQGIFQNPMASPDFLGASSGATLGASLAIIMNKGGSTITAWAFLASVGTVLFVIFLSQKAPGNPVTNLILAGVIISSLCSSATSFIKLCADPNEQLPQITYWLMGTIKDTRLQDVLPAFVPMVLGLIPLLLLRWKMNLLTLGDEEATSLGINVNRVRVIVILCSTLITAASVSSCGMIGWVGLVIPHFARRLVGNNYMRLLPATMVLGAVFLLIVDNLARTLLQTELPLGILTAVIGAPFFVYLITRKDEVL